MINQPMQFGFSLLTTLCAVTICLLISGCKKPNPNPELLDPIYSDLMGTQTAFAAKVEAQKKKIADLSAEIAELPPADPSTKRTIREKYNLERGLVQLEQEALYYEVRAKQRLEYARKTYLAAFHKGETWPDPAEYEEYKARLKLKTAPRNWDERVPKTTRYSKQEPTPPPKSTESSGAH